MHCKDQRAGVHAAVRERDSSFLDAVVDGVFTVPGDGSIDFPEVLGALGRSGYEGWLVVEAEQDPDKANPCAYAELGYGNLRRFAAERQVLSVLRAEFLSKKVGREFEGVVSRT